MYHQDFEARFVAINDIIVYIELDYNEERSAKDCFAATTQDKSYDRSGTRIEKGLGYLLPRKMWFSFQDQATQVKYLFAYLYQEQ